MQLLGISVDSHFTHLAWRECPRHAGGLGDIAYPILGDLTKEISRAYDVLLPSGIVAGGSDLGDPALLAAGLAVALLSSAIPYSLELEALRRLPKGTFGVLMSLEPAVAALVGLVALGQELSAGEVVAIALVVAASAGALSAARTPSPVEA